jgi:hypothetical protein
MAIKNNIFLNCADNTSSVVLQYNDIFFASGTIAFYDNKCWVDSGVSSVLVPLADVTFDNYDTCEVCNQSNLSGFVLVNCVNSDVAVVTFSNDQLPQIGDFVLYDNSCWEVTSTTGATTNVSSQLNSYSSCEICQTFIPPGEPQYEKAEFVNCCDDSDTQIFNIVVSNFGFPFGNTVIFNNNCYTFVGTSVSGVIVASYLFPDYLDCETCRSGIPCPTPTPTPTITVTNTPTPSVTPTISPTSSLTPTPTNTPFLTPTPTPSSRPSFRNECDPITLFPLGVSCEVVNPTTPISFDGSVTLTITGGTPPYSIVWNNGVVNATSLINLKSGTYSATVIDYYGDFTASTICEVVAPTPTPTTTPTPTPTPSSTPAPVPNLCLTLLVDNQPYQFEFTGSTTINGYPSWSALTTNTPVTTAGNYLTLSWVIGSPSGFRITGFDSNLWYLGTTSSSIPPVSGWLIYGSSPGVTNVSLVSGDCPLYVPIFLTVYTNDTSCELSNDGSICVVAAGGSGNYEYSLDNVLFVSTNCFYNLASGSYTVYVRDTTTSSVVTQNVVVSNAGTSQTVTLQYTQTSLTTLILTAASQRVLKVFDLNTSVIPVGVTVNLGFAISNLFEVWEPGDGDNVGTQVVIEKNGVPITITPVSSSNTLTNRPNCNPYKIQGYNSGSTANTSVISTDTIQVKLTSQVTITDPATDNCNTRLENNLGVVGSFTYSGLDECVVISSGNVNMNNIVSRTLGGS